MKSITLVASAALFLITSCGTSSTFDDIKTDMTSQEVIDIMGEPSGKYKIGSDKTGEIEIWHYKTDEVISHSLSFKNGSVSKITVDYQEEQKKLKSLIKI